MISISCSAWLTIGSADEPEYPTAGARIDYYRSGPPAEPLVLEILDSTGTVLRTFRSAAPVAASAQRCSEPIATWLKVTPATVREKIEGLGYDVAP